MTQTLFTPLTLRGVTLPNRVAMSPMCQYAAAGDGMATDWHMAHLGSRAIGGCGLVTVEATSVEPRGRLTPGDLGIWSDAQAAALAPVAAFIRAQGSVAGIQLAHAGRKGARTRPWEGGGRPLSGAEGWRCIAPSAVAFEGYEVPDAMDAVEMDVVERAYADAAHRAVAAGFQLINLHFAHGYLPHEFLSPLSNLRDDDFGGSPDNRARYPLRLVRAVRAALPDAVPIVLRLSCEDWAPGGFGPDDAIAAAPGFADAGADLIECSSAGLVRAESPPEGPGYQVHIARRMRDETGLPTGTVGMIWDPALAEEIVASDAADLVTLGRALLDDPFWPQHAAEVLGVPPGQGVSWPLPYRRGVGRLRTAQSNAGAADGQDLP